MNKVLGEKKLYNFKKKYFDLFTFREKMYIRFRHYAVMTVAYKRNNQYIKVIGNGIAMIISSPIDFILELSRYGSNILKLKRMEN